MAVTLGEIASRFDLTLKGDASATIDGVCPLLPGTPGRLAYLVDRRLRGRLSETQATAVIVGAGDAAQLKAHSLIAKDPAVAYARVARLFDSTYQFEPGVHPLASVDASARLAPGCYVGAAAVIEAGVEVGRDSYIGPGSVIRRDARLGEGCWLTARVYVGLRCQLGQRVHIEPGAVIGGRGFGLARAPEGWLEIPQLGAVRIGNDVEIGANTTIDRGTFADTEIGDGVKLDNQIQIGHNCTVGAHTAIAACTGIAGSTQIGKRVLIGGAVGIGGHLSVGDDAVLLAGTMVTKSIPAKMLTGGALPHQTAQGWRRMVSQLRRLDGTLARIRALEKAVGLKGADEGESLESDEI
jgi:UDP-3-O-[3-hydroxymyristoyl] glucosamine N-acyltransferase